MSNATETSAASSSTGLFKLVKNGAMAIVIGGAALVLWTFLSEPRPVPAASPSLIANQDYQHIVDREHRIRAIAAQLNAIVNQAPTSSQTHALPIPEKTE